MKYIPILDLRDLLSNMNPSDGLYVAPLKRQTLQKGTKITIKSSFAATSDREMVRSHSSADNTHNTLR